MNIAPKVKTYNDTVNLKIKQNAKVKLLQGSADKNNKNREVVYQGRIFSINSKHFTIKNKNGINESFLYSDLICERYKLEVV